MRSAVFRFCSYAGRRCASTKSLADHDPELKNMLDRELERQVTCLELIASENFTSRPVLECLGSVATNKYAEGLPGARYYGGNDIIDEIENLCRTRCLEAFRLNPEEWGVNVQPYSGSVANLAAYASFLSPHDRLMGLDLPHGGHLTHGFYTPKRKVSASSIFYESFPYKLGEDGFVDYDALEVAAKVYCPKLIIAGGSAYPREWDYARYRKICDSVGARLMVDMAHISGLVAAQEADDPFKYADVVTSTTHKTLRGPRSGLVFWNKKTTPAADDAVFPMIQGGPHMHQIAALATQLKEVQSPEFKEYIKQVKKNAKAIAAYFLREGYTLVSGGTDNHLLLMDLRDKGLTGSKAQEVLDLINITTNKNSVVGDKSAMNPGGLRIGAPALTTRGFKEQDFEKVGEFIHRGLQEGLKIQASSGKKLADFVAAAHSSANLKEIKAEVVEFAKQFPFPGMASDFPLTSA